MTKKILLVILALFMGLAVSQQKTTEQIIQEEQEKMRQMQEDFLKQQEEIQQEYLQYEKQISAEYEALERAEAQRLKEMEDKIREQWNDTKISTNKEFVDYDEDFKSRGSIDFEKGEVKIEVLQDEKNKNSDGAVKKLEQQLSKLIKEEDEKGNPILEKQLKDTQGNPISKKQTKAIIEDLVKEGKINEEKIKGGNGEIKYKYTIQMKLVPDHLRVRLDTYKDEILKQSERFKLDPALVCAIIHTESYFNPKARSHVPAYGLMQLVPKSGARDAYLYVYKKDRLLRSNYLFEPSNNIELGCGYIALLKFSYLKAVNSDEKNDVCAICAYNTGAGNVARAINGTTNINKAANIINARDFDWLNDKLLKDLPYEETKNYLKKVTERREIYKRAL
ncbi:MAG: DUF3393 domain-containing protein [Candidatus Marinimicrobia bacterium]|nr:DUF3393 domain-containing protein [Candidatus Neomarinimicrobiota bacterium]